MRLVQALLAVGVLGVLPGLPTAPEECVGEAVEEGRSTPIAGVGGVAGKAECCVCNVRAVADAMALSERPSERLCRGGFVAFLTKHPTQIDHGGRVVKSNGGVGLLCTLQEASRRRQIAFSETVNPRIVVKGSGEALITGSFDALDGFSRERLGAIGLHLVDTHEKEDEGGTKQAVVADAPGPFHRGIAVSNPAASAFRRSRGCSTGPSQPR